MTGSGARPSCRRDRPSPLDEVRTAMAVFDETLFRLVPRVYRALDAALGEATGPGRRRARAYLRWGSWVGGDRDGNPNVTAEVTRAAIADPGRPRAAGLEAATRRIGHALTVAAARRPPSAGAARRRSTATPRRLPRPGRGASAPARRTSRTGRLLLGRAPRRHSGRHPAPRRRPGVPRAGRARSPTCGPGPGVAWPRPGRPGWPTASSST